MNIIVNLPIVSSLLFFISRKQCELFHVCALIDCVSRSRRKSYACEQFGKLCSDRTPENKISVLRAYKGNDTFYAWKNGQNLISISRRTYPRHGVSARDLLGKRTYASFRFACDLDQYNMNTDNLFRDIS